MSTVTVWILIAALRGSGQFFHIDNIASEAECNRVRTELTGVIDGSRCIKVEKAKL